MSCRKATPSILLACAVLLASCAGGQPSPSSVENRELRPGGGVAFPEGAPEDAPGNASGQAPGGWDSAGPDAPRARSATPSPSPREIPGTGDVVARFGGPTELVAPAAHEPAEVVIPAIGVRSQLLRLGLNPDQSLEVPGDYDLAGWYERSPAPGELGPAIIAGHVDSRGGPAIFYRLEELEAGDEVEVVRGDGQTVRFRVDRVERYPKDEFPTEAVYGNTEGSELRLITCGGDFDRSRRSYRDNIIAFATLIDDGDEPDPAAEAGDAGSAGQDAGPDAGADADGDTEGDAGPDAGEDAGEDADGDTEDGGGDAEEQDQQDTADSPST